MVETIVQFLENTKNEASKMTQQVKRLATKSDNLGWMPEIYMEEVEKQILK